MKWQVSVWMWCFRSSATILRSYINKLCKEERAALNGKTSKGNKKCKEGDVITLQVPEPTELEILPEEMNLDIVYEDQDVILINKPKGMVVHPAAGHYSGTLVNGLMAHCKMICQELTEC